MKCIRKPSVSKIVFFLFLLASHSIAAEFENGYYEIEVSPSSPTTGSTTTLVVSLVHSACIGITSNGVRVNQIARTIDVSLNLLYIDFLGPCPISIVPHDIVLGVLSNAGNYKVSIFEDDQGLQPGVVFGSENLDGQFTISVSEPSLLSRQETPADGSIQSGVGLIRGWACDASRIEVQFDDLPRMQTAYGSTRPDTEMVCGDVNNGYGLVYAFGLLGEGIHRMKTFIDGEKISDVQFEVTGLDEPFITGLAAAFELPDFPYPGESVQIRWSEPDQNFIITEHNK